jgi:hypothetical protein
VEQMHLENGSLHTALLFIMVKPKIGLVENLDDSMLTDTSPLLIPFGKFDFKVSVVGLNHGKKDEYFVVEVLDKEKMQIKKSRSPF